MCQTKKELLRKCQTNKGRSVRVSKKTNDMVLLCPKKEILRKCENDKGFCVKFPPKNQMTYCEGIKQKRT